MKIGGFQKFSLLDYPGQLAAIVFTQGCNFRCPYCHNPELVDPARFAKPLATGRVLDFLKRRRGKLGAVVITGGEPTLQPDLPRFVKQLKFMGFLVKIDTNGSRPDMLQNLAEQELVDYWAMDVKAPPDLYRLVSRSNVPVEDIRRSMDILRGSGREYEFRTTFFERLFDWRDISRIQELLQPGDSYYLQECRYEDTLEDLGSGSTDVRKHLQDNPACKSLLRWGDKHHVNIHIRSL
ncbi:MAG: anaerobic ribonucleoside-triphosphate reductase activating protein [Candidatus Cloacimonetes bacterium]|jgi:pyruvate formate lyase activating enzyme|nr:anaerobic ribonucleoside-triphosphate reductase activating protein [Candidatus Cloacimonadota bacterium]MDD4223421.1 anaerobic ribonucleoside-triphosphate reductase activating protein [Candidatus Cloacimonadota bacterium]